MMMMYSLSKFKLATVSILYLGINSIDTQIDPPTPTFQRFKTIQTKYPYLLLHWVFPTPLLYIANNHQTPLFLRKKLISFTVLFQNTLSAYKMSFFFHTQMN